MPCWTKLKLCWIEWKRFWWISVLNELFPSSSHRGWRWFTGYYVQSFCMSVKKGCQKTRGTGSKGSKKAKTLATDTAAIAMWPWKSWQRSGFGTEQRLGRWESGKQRAISSCCAAPTLLRETKLLCSFQICVTICVTKVPYLPGVSPISVFPKD